MKDPHFSVLGAYADQHVAQPTIVFRLQIVCDGDVEAMALRSQLRIEPQWRSYGAAQKGLLHDLFGAPERWSQTLRSLAWADVPLMVTAFRGRTEADVRVPCTYDFDVTASKFLAAIDDGEIPVRLLFSGSVFRRAPEGFSAELVPWASECAYRLPAGVWSSAMKACCGDAALIRIDRETFDELHRYRARSGAQSWEHAFACLLERGQRA